MSAPVKERPVVRRLTNSMATSRATSLQMLKETRAEIEQDLFDMSASMRPWTPFYAYDTMEASEERLKAFRDAIKAYRALLKYVNAAIRAGEAAQ